MKLRQIIDGFFLTRRNRLAATTQAGYRRCFNRLAKFLGEDKVFDTITPTDIRYFLNHLRAGGFSERSTHDYLAILSALWTFAEREFKLPHIIRAIEKPKFVKRQIIPFTEEEVKAIVDAAEYAAEWNSARGKMVRSRRESWRRDVAIIMILVDTGLRVSEMCDLRVSDYQQDNGRLVIRHGKGDKQRVVFCGATAQRVLWRYMLERKRLRPSDPLFATRTNKPIDRNNFRHLVGRIGDNAGVSNVHPHRFRHTFAITFLRNGGNVFELQQILGHSDLETVKVYLRLADTDIQRAQQAHSPADNWNL